MQWLEQDFWPEGQLILCGRGADSACTDHATPDAASCGRCSAAARDDRERGRVSKDSRGSRVWDGGHFGMAANPLELIAVVEAILAVGGCVYGCSVDSCCPGSGITSKPIFLQVLYRKGLH